MGKSFFNEDTNEQQQQQHYTTITAEGEREMGIFGPGGETGV
jgi:hypothetical protein